MPRLVPAEPEWKKEKHEFQEKIQNQKLKILKLQPNITFVDQVEQAVQAQGVYDRPRLTKADKENNIRSLFRKMENRLYFILKKKNEEHWQFPHLQHQTGETLRQTVERANQSHVPNFGVYILSNAPDVHCDFLENGHTRRLFLYRSYHLKGKPTLGEDAVDYAWVTKSELKGYLNPVLYGSVKDLLLDH